LEEERLVSEGFAPRDAYYEARRRFGNVTSAQETFHRRRTVWWMENFPHQLSRAARRLSRAPVFSITVALTLTLGIGATTALFSVIDGVLLRPLPFKQPARLVSLSHSMVLQGISHVDQSDATYLYYRSANHVFSDIGAYRTAPVNFSTQGENELERAQRVDAARTSASVFQVLGVPPLAGRVFRESEDLPGSAPVVLIGEQLWRSRFAADPDVLGRRVSVDGVERTIVGIMPEQFAFPNDATALWLPIGIDPARTRSAAFDFHAVARLRQGVTTETAAADLQKLLPLVPEAYPGRLTAAAIDLTHMRAEVQSLREFTVGGVERTLWVVFCAAAFLLLVACSNVINLFLVRADERQHELAVRRALGAGRGVILLEFLSEALILSAVSGLLGIALAEAALGTIRSLSLGLAIPRLESVGINGAALSVGAGLTVLTMLVMSAATTLRSSGAAVAPVLGQTGSTTAGRTRHRTRQVLVVVQVALALVLIAGAGLMARSFQALRSVPAGFDVHRVNTYRVDLPEAAYSSPASVVNFVTRGLNEIAALPGSLAAGAITKLPLDDEARRDTAVFVEDKQLAMGEMPNVHQVAFTTSGSFEALGIPFLQGHTFERPPDPARAPLEVIVTHAFAERYWGDAQAVGRRLRLAPDGPAFTVIGVTGNVVGTRLDGLPDETVYLPLVTAPGPATSRGNSGSARFAPRDLAFVVRKAGRMGDLTDPVERILASLDPGLPVYSVRSMAQVVSRSTSRTSFTLAMLEIASAIALLIGAVGLYGVVSYMVSLRAREMAVRLAIGAQPVALRTLVLRQALSVTALGIAVGLGATLLLARFLDSLLFGVGSSDPLTLGAAVMLLAGVAIVASWVPARRAAAADPAMALRADV
jgi:predicted permease